MTGTHAERNHPSSGGTWLAAATLGSLLGWAACGGTTPAPAEPAPTHTVLVPLVADDEDGDLRFECVPPEPHAEFRVVFESRMDAIVIDSTGREHPAPTVSDTSATYEVELLRVVGGLPTRARVILREARRAHNSLRTRQDRDPWDLAVARGWVRANQPFVVERHGRNWCRSDQPDCGAGTDPQRGFFAAVGRTVEMLGVAPETARSLDGKLVRRAASLHLAPSLVNRGIAGDGASHADRDGTQLPAEFSTTGSGTSQNFAKHRSPDGTVTKQPRNVQWSAEVRIALNEECRVTEVDAYRKVWVPDAEGDHPAGTRTLRTHRWFIEPI